MSAEEIGGYGITGHYGKGGSGKSLDIVETDVIPALQKGRKVITNLPLLIDGIMTYYRGIDYRNIILCTHEELSQKMIARMARSKEDPGEFAHALIVWDEIQDVFPSGFKRRGTAKEQAEYDHLRDAFIAYLAWSRHDHSEFVWATQHYSSVDVELRRKTHIYIQHEHLFHLGLKKTWVARSQLPDSMTGDPVPDAGGTVRTLGPNPIIYRCYKSAEVGNHSLSSRQHAMIPKKIIVVFVFALVALGWAGLSMWRRGGDILDVSGAGAKLVSGKGPDTSHAASIAALPAVQLATQNISKGQNNASVDSYICMHGRCVGYLDGVPSGRWWHDLAPAATDSGGVLRGSLLARGLSRLGDGSGAMVPR